MACGEEIAHSRMTARPADMRKEVSGWRKRFRAFIYAALVVYEQGVMILFGAVTHGSSFRGSCLSIPHPSSIHFDG